MEHKATGYSVWLMPEESAFKDLQKTIFDLADKYKTTSFDPHITIIGGVSGSEEGFLKKFKITL